MSAKSYKKLEIPSFTLLLSIASLILQACGSTNYSSVSSVTQSDAPGKFSIPPKVDILVVEDDTGSMFEPYTTISSQLQTFVNSLDAQNWNYHFAVAPLTASNYNFQAIASKQDVNWGSYWTAPFAGDPKSDSYVGSLDSMIFSTLTSYSGLSEPIFNGFVNQSRINNSLNGYEPGLMNLQASLSNQVSKDANGNPTNFIRPDALLAVIFVGNGNDTSYVNYCYRSDGIQAPCEQVITTTCSSGLAPWQVFNDIANSGVQACTPGSASYTSCQTAAKQSEANWNARQCNSAALSQSYYQQALAQISPNLKIYAAVANESYRNSAGCNGGYSSVGSRYQAMASISGGNSYDICTNQLPTILSNIQNDLTTVVLNYVTSYVVTSANIQPDPATIVVQKYIGGDPNNAVTIPQSSSNGWTYIGYQTKNLITYPTPMNQKSGYMLQLSGSAQLQGNDTAYVTWKTPNGQSGTTTQ